MPSVLFYINSLDMSVLLVVFITMFFRTKTFVFNANDVDPDQMLSNIDNLILCNVDQQKKE